MIATSYSAGAPWYNHTLLRYVFALSASADIYDFVARLPGIQDTYVSAISGALCVVFKPLHAYDQECANRAYNAVLVGIEAHLNPPDDEDTVKLERIVLESDSTQEAR